MPLTTRWSMAPPARTESSIVLRVGDFGGAPRWCNAIHLVPQLMVMPALKLIAALVPTIAAPCGQLFFTVFGHMLLFDFWYLKLNAVMIAHHGTCLLGHMFGCFVAPEAFVRYFNACTALEIGSGASCAWWNHGEQLPLDGTYFWTMTASNACAALELIRWAQSATSLHGVFRVLPVPITLYLIYVRQIECVRVVRDGRGAATTG